MTETQFWARLQARVSEELARMPDCAQPLRCRGFLPRSYLFGEDPPCIVGEARMGEAPGKLSGWRFVIVVPAGFEAAGCVGWDTLLPSEPSTAWCAVDAEAKRLVLVPGAATSSRNAARGFDPADTGLLATLFARCAQAQSPG